MGHWAGTPRRSSKSAATLLLLLALAAAVVILWIKLAARELHDPGTVAAITVFGLAVFLLMIWGIAQGNRRRPGVYWPRFWRFFQREGLIWDEYRSKWIGEWSQDQQNPAIAVNQPIPGPASADALWKPNSKQWLAIWISAMLAAFVIFVSVVDEVPTEAIAAVIPLGLGALGVWHLETRRKG